MKGLETLETIEIEGDGKSNSSPKQSIQLKMHCFTYNNYKNEHIEILETTLVNFKHIHKCVFQEEICPTTGTPHLQGAVWFKTKTRWEQLKLPFGNMMRWSKMRNEDACIKYCQKSETAKPGSKPFIFGFPKPIKTIEHLYPWQQEIEEIYLTEPDDRKVYWYWEQKGNTGKSAFCKYMYIKHNILFCNGGKASDLINLCFNADMDNTKCVIWDLPRSTGGNISYNAIEMIKNGLICNTKYETGNKVFNPPHIFIFANAPPDKPELLSADRWVIKYLGDEMKTDEE